MKEPPHTHYLSPNETHSERIFTSLVKCLASYRFSIALPLKHPSIPRRFLDHGSNTILVLGTPIVERSLSQQYKEFMGDCLTRLHIEVIPMNQIMSPYCY
ncbi:unnamed protein product [Macrosiphum euphorbiae]|uniref:Uncharacterized protein n=1 Tax=Macrosiphum euphorbiae TaxID=13131 RepID=A0AAV0WHE3_9HEMI|nr:unnamed protein product [Macrosiphum euphorbiae]